MSRDSATWRNVTHSANARTGTLIRNANRQPTLSTINPPSSGPSRTSPDVAAAQMPNARPRSGPASKVWRDDREGAGHEQCARRALEQPEDDQPLERRGEAAQHRCDGEARQPDRVDPPPAVVIGQRPRDDQQGGEDREIAADDVGLALEDAEERRRQLAPDAGQREVDDGAVEEHGSGPDDGRNERPALARRHAAQSRR